MSIPTTAAAAPSMSSASPGDGARASRDPERAHLGRGLVAGDAVARHGRSPGARPRATSSGPPTIASTARRSRPPGARTRRTRAGDTRSAGSGCVKSASMPKSAQIRPRMSLIESVPNAVLELRRTPPPVSLEWMITEIDEATVVVVAVERRFVDRAGQSRDAISQPRLGNRTGDQPGLRRRGAGPARSAPGWRGARPRGRPDRRKRAPHRRDSRRIPHTRSGLLVLGDVVDLQHREREPTFGALVAVSAVPPALRIDARERVLQREIVGPARARRPSSDRRTA